MNNSTSRFIAPSLAGNQIALWTWMPLIFSLYYFRPLLNVIILNSGLPPIDVISIISALFIYFGFVYCYISCQKHDERTAIRPIVAIIVLSCLGMYFNPESLIFLAFSSYFIGYYYPAPKSIIGFILTLSLLLSITLFLSYNSPPQIYIGTPILGSSIISFLFGFTVRRSRMYNVNEQRSQQQIEQLATVAERERIARDLHDLLGHTLSSIALKAELAEKLAKAGHAEKSIDEISQVAKITRETLSEVRQAVSGYKAKDPQAEVDKIVARLVDKNFTLVQQVSLKNLTAKAESSLILILKEAITNILRHSNGNHVIVKTQHTQGSLLLTIFDNGSHYSAKNKEPLFSNGLKGIIERVSELKGNFSINTEQGFELSINLPIEVFISEK